MVIHGTDSPFSSHTKLAELFPPLHGYHIPLIWMVSDFEGCPTPKIFQSDSPFLINGQELDLVMQSVPDMQSIWGVFSGFRLPASEIDTSIVPVAENPTLWEPSYQIQHPQAECEVVAWDSSATFFRSKNGKAMWKFSRAFPSAKNLEDFNTGKS